MNYELAKKLKDAGFPQRNEPLEPETEPDICPVVYLPTLSELIEECGDKLMSIHRTIPHQGNNKDWWAAECYFELDTDEETPTPWASRIKTGNTPEEAVARLYLALNNKTK